MNIAIITDSGCDIEKDYADQLGITVLPLKTYFGEEEYLDGVTLSHDDFYKKLIETDVFPTTSQLSPYDFGKAFKEALENHDCVLYMSISAKLSGCYQSAAIAATDYEGRVFLIDTLNVCIGQRILVELAVRFRDEGLTIDEMTEKLEYQKTKVRLIALLDTLEYLKKGGRISPMVATAGNLLSIKPVIAIIKGEVVMLGKARGSKAGNNKLSELVNAESGILFDMPLCLAYTGLSDILLRKYIEDFSYMYEEYTSDLPISTIGCAIGTHVGPGAIAVAFFAK